MKILVLGIADFSFLFQNTYSAFKSKYKETEYFNVKKYRRIVKYIKKDFDVNLFRKRVYKLKPDLIFIVAPYYIKKDFYDVMNEYKANNSCVISGWIGDRFEENEVNHYISKSLDKKFLSDTYFFNFYEKSNALSYLPLATNPNIFFSDNWNKPIFSSFVASSTNYRETQLEKVAFPLHVYGTGWEKFKKSKRNDNLIVHAKKLNIHQTADIYKSSMSVLNLTNENNLVNGLNQRAFDPYMSNAIVLQEYCKDLELCFEPNKEIVVFSTIEELNEKIDEYKVDKNLFNNVLLEGKKRVLSEHTFDKRVEQIMRDII